MNNKFGPFEDDEDELVFPEDIQDDNPIEEDERELWDDDSEDF